MSYYSNQRLTLMVLANGLTQKSRALSGYTINPVVEHRIDNKHAYQVEDYLSGALTFKQGAQITESIGHPFKHKFDGDLGGPFGTTKSSLAVDAKLFSGISYDFNKVYRVRNMLWDPNGSLGITSAAAPLLDLEYPLDLDARGADAIAICNPINPIVDASTTFAESVREGIPVVPGLSFWKERAKLLLGASSEFLNAEFGWLPLIDEITKFGKTVKKSRDILVQYKRDEGKLVRRKFNFPISESENIIKSEPNSYALLLAKGGNPGLSAGYFYTPDPKGTTRTIERSMRRTWFSGAFRYYIPDQNDPWSGVMAHGSYADKLFGTSLTPEILWELAPWSWAVDYFTNAQSVITNLQNFAIYGEILAYGYAMDELVQSRTVDWIPDDNSPFRGPCSTYSRLQSRKLRRAANPFGFGLTVGDLSPTQLAILAAAGLTTLL